MQFLTGIDVRPKKVSMPKVDKLVTNLAAYNMR